MAEEEIVLAVGVEVLAPFGNSPATDALHYLEDSGGWEVGVGPSVVVVDEGMAKTVTTTTEFQDAYAFIFNQKGLMAGLGVQGSKISEFIPR